MLTKLQEMNLARLVELGDIEARNKMVEANRNLVYKVASKYGPHEHLDDFIQEGTLGLIRAIEKYDWRKGFKFSQYAVFWIRKYISDYIQSGMHSIRTPYYVKVRPEVFDIEEMHTIEPDVASYWHNDALDALYGGIQALPDIQQKVVSKMYGLHEEAMPIADVAKELGLTELEVHLLLEHALLSLNVFMSEFV